MKKLLLESLQKLDFIAWWLTILFFLWSSLIMWWNINESFMWASWIIVLMFCVWFSIEIILWSLNNIKWLWKITWFITNWPEALVLIVWLITWNILFAASTPLWSNLMNPLLLFIAILITWYLFKLKELNHRVYFIWSFILTAILAVLFFKLPENYYIYWLILTLIVSILLFFKKYNHHSEEYEEEKPIENKYYLPIWIIILVISWYFLDPVVNFTAEASKSPKWLIWFLILAILTSWPEFKSVIGLLKRKKSFDAFINILVSNITNLWLAIIWIFIWLYLL